MAKVTVIDYGIGNLLSVSRAFEYHGAEVLLTDSAEVIMHAERLVLPGVGAFSDGMQGLQTRGLIEPIKAYARQDRPFLGICLGMQMMLDRSEEFGLHEGLGLVPGDVIRIADTKENGAPHKIPHIGWNELVLPAGLENWDGTILQEFPPGQSVYFVHSFTANPQYPANRLADCFYNGRVISAAIRSGNLYGCQFHPEKSGPIGLNIIKSFLRI